MKAGSGKSLHAATIGELTRAFMETLNDQLGLSCVALNPGCRDIEADLALRCGRIDEIDFFGVGSVVDSRKLADVEALLPDRFHGRFLRLAAVNGPFRIAYPDVPTLVFHLTIWPEKWLTRVCPFVVNGFRKARIFAGTAPGSLVPRRQPEPGELLSWHYGLENCLKYIRRGSFEAPTWWIDGEAHNGKPFRHDISDPYRMTEFVAYALHAALCNMEDFPEVGWPLSNERARSLSAAFRTRAVDARNGDPVDPGWLFDQKPAAESLIEKWVRELKALL